jgi:2-alkenal reductase
MTWRRLLLFVIAIILVGGSAVIGAMAGGVVVYRWMSQNQVAVVSPQSPSIVAVEPVSSQTQTLAVNTTDVETTITQAVQNVGPAVVTVVATIPSQQTFFGATGEETSTGSGVFISPDGYVLTNNHVIEGADKFQVIYSDGSQQDAILVGTDQYSDLAVLKVSDNVPSPPGTPTLSIQVTAVGSPWVIFKNTVTVGWSAPRSFDRYWSGAIDGLIQTDAAIN